MRLLNRNAGYRLVSEASGQRKTGWRYAFRCAVREPSEQQVAASDLVIEPAVKLVCVADRRRADHVIVGARARRVGNGIVFQAGIPDQPEPGLRNDVACEGLASAGRGI